MELLKMKKIDILAMDVVKQLQDAPHQVALAEAEGVRVIGHLPHPLFPGLTPGGKPRIRVLVKRHIASTVIDRGSYILSIEEW